MSEGRGRRRPRRDPGEWRPIRAFLPRKVAGRWVWLRVIWRRAWSWNLLMMGIHPELDRVAFGRGPSGIGTVGSVHCTVLGLCGYEYRLHPPPTLVVSARRAA